MGHDIHNAVVMQMAMEHTKRGYEISIGGVLRHFCSGKCVMDRKSTQQCSEDDQTAASEEFELTANSLGAHMKVTESSHGLDHGELILRTFI